MHSADYAVARCPSVCSSVCHTPVLSLNGYGMHIIKVFSPSGSPTILVFPHQTERQYSDGDPPNGGAECKGVCEIHHFRQISRFISQLIQDRASYYARRIGNCTQAFEWYQFE